MSYSLWCREKLGVGQRRRKEQRKTGEVGVWRGVGGGGGGGAGECRKIGVGFGDEPKKGMWAGQRKRIKTNEGRQTTADNKK